MFQKDIINTCNSVKLKNSIEFRWGISMKSPCIMGIFKSRYPQSFVISMKIGEIIKKSNNMILFVVITVCVFSLWYVSSFSSASSTDLSPVYVLNVKHNSSHNSDPKFPSDSTVYATLNLKTDIFNDSACDSIFGRHGKSCINNDQMKFSVKVSKGGTVLYNKIIYGSPEVNSIQVPTSPDSTKSDSDIIKVDWVGPKYFNAGAYPIDRPDQPDWEINYTASVGTLSCEKSVWAGATVDCNLVVHYAWIGH